MGNAMVLDKALHLHRFKQYTRPSQATCARDNALKDALKFGRTYLTDKQAATVVTCGSQGD